MNKNERGIKVEKDTGTTKRRFGLLVGVISCRF